MCRRLLKFAVVVFIGACGVVSPSAATSTPESSSPTSAAVRQCGTENYGFGEGFDQLARDCLWSRYQAGLPARFVTVHRTHEGAPQTYTVEVLGPSRLAVTYDDAATQPSRTLSYVCSGLTHRALNEAAHEAFAATGCAGASGDLVF